MFLACGTVPLVKICFAPAAPTAPVELMLDRQVADIDVMDEMQIVRRQLLFDHQPAHRRAIATEQVLLDHPRLVKRHLEMLRDKFGDAHGNPQEQV